jgi:fructose-1,6-bisphosphatase/inositol monophosphatase family enzyme
VNTQEILELLQDVAERVINPRFRTLSADQIDSKDNPGDLVTVADREAEVLITDALREAYPDALVLGEEANHGDDTLLGRFRAADHAFTVDPVDGTKNFVSGSKDHAVMAAELRDGEVQRSWIWQPQHRAAYVAERGGGAWRNGERLVRPPVGEVLRGVTSRRRWIGRSLGSLPPLELTWVCCGVDYPKLVEGAADYLIYSGTQPWDHAPGSLLLEESGAFLGTFEGGRYQPQDPPPVGLVGAADRAMYDLVQGLLSELG